MYQQKQWQTDETAKKEEAKAKEAERKKIIPKEMIEIETVELVSKGKTKEERKEEDLLGQVITKIKKIENVTQFLKMMDENESLLKSCLQCLNED